MGPALLLLCSSGELFPWWWLDICAAPILSLPKQTSPGGWTCAAPVLFLVLVGCHRIVQSNDAHKGDLLPLGDFQGAGDLLERAHAKKITLTMQITDERNCRDNLQKLLKVMNPAVLLSCTQSTSPRQA